MLRHELVQRFKVSVHVKLKIHKNLNGSSENKASNWYLHTIFFAHETFDQAKYGVERVGDIYVVKTDNLKGLGVDAKPRQLFHENRYRIDLIEVLVHRFAKVQDAHWAANYEVIIINGHYVGDDSANFEYVTHAKVLGGKTSWSNYVNAWAIFTDRQWERYCGPIKYIR